MVRDVGTPLGCEVGIQVGILGSSMGPLWVVKLESK